MNNHIRLGCIIAGLGVLMPTSLRATVPVFGGTATPDDGAHAGSGFFNTPGPGRSAGNGVAVMGARVRDASDHDIGDRAFRWNTTGTAAPQLQILGTHITGYTNAYASDINSTGTVV